MTARRVMGAETEYAVSLPGTADKQHVSMSFDVVNAASTQDTRHIRWDYGSEDPTHDARGYHIPRASAHRDMLTDDAQWRLTNVPLPNGGRVYVDHAHPEYSTPEALSAYELLAYKHAGDRIIAQAAASCDTPYAVYCNNVDGKGASWGSHENYEVSRAVPFDDVARIFTLHAVTRQIFAGSGRVGLGERSEREGFQISQRADYFHRRIGLQTTFDRPIVNTRDESHHDDEHRRFHVIVGDAHRMDVPFVLSLGTTSLILWALEKSYELDYESDLPVMRYEFADPVAAMHEVSHDLSLTAQLDMVPSSERDVDVLQDDTVQMSAIGVQISLRSWVYEIGAIVYGTDSRGEPLWPDDETAQILDLWKTVLLDCLMISERNDDERLEMTGSASRIEWFAKWQILERMRRRKNSSWSYITLQAMDMSWGELSQSSIFAKIAHRCMRLVSDEEITHAMADPPEDTRAYTRGKIIANYAADVIAVSWDSVVVRQQGAGVLCEIRDPRSATRDKMGDTFTASHTIEDVVTRLGSA